MVDKKSTAEKFGRLFRPIFWAFLMAESFHFLFEILSSFSVKLKTFGLFDVSIFLLIFSGIFFFAAYKVSHPHFSIEGHDQSDEYWGVFGYIFVPAVALELIFRFIWGISLFDLLSEIN